MSEINYRTPTPEDLSALKDNLSRDEHHSTQDPLWWEKENLSVFFDEKGNRVWVRVEPCIRLHIQHEDSASRQEIANILVNGFPKLTEDLKRTGFRQIIVESVAPLLIRFIKRHLGFKKSDSDYTLPL